MKHAMFHFHEIFIFVSPQCVVKLDRTFILGRSNVFCDIFAIK